MYGRLAQAADLETCFEGSKSGKQGGQMVNVKRNDTGEYLFKRTPADEVVLDSHIWNQVKIDDQWIPVDSTNNLTGLTPDGLETFKRACYQSYISNSFVRGLPNGLKEKGYKYDGLRVGENSKAIEVEINSNQNFKGPLSFNVARPKNPIVGGFKINSVQEGIIK